jgi:hypothetical protein
MVGSVGGGPRLIGMIHDDPGRSPISDDGQKRLRLLDEKLDPDVPKVILAGNGRIIEADAEQLGRQRVPVRVGLRAK